MSNGTLNDERIFMKQNISCSLLQKGTSESKYIFSEYPLAAISIAATLIALVVATFLADARIVAILLGVFSSTLMLLQGFIISSKKHKEDLDKAMDREEFKVISESRIEAITSLAQAKSISKYFNENSDGIRLSGVNDKIQNEIKDVEVAIKRSEIHKLIEDHEDNFQCYITYAMHHSKEIFESSSSKTFMDIYYKYQMRTDYIRLVKEQNLKDTFPDGQYHIYGLTNLIRTTIEQGLLTPNNAESFKKGCELLSNLIAYRCNK
ncbi:hypothetical protein N9R79_03855 [Vibrio sp.]|nr:hypothetical protein [Vibrio sp.]